MALSNLITENTLKYTYYVKCRQTQSAEVNYR